MESYFEQFFIIIVTTQTGPAGPVTSWSKGQSFDGLYIVDTSTQVRIAEAQGTKIRGRFITSPGIPVNNNSIVQRASDSVYFKLIGEPKKSPPQAESQLKYFDAEITTKA